MSVNGDSNGRKKPTRFGEFKQLVGCYCSYLLPRKDGRISSQLDVVAVQMCHHVRELNLQIRGVMIKTFVRTSYVNGPCRPSSGTRVC